MSDQGQSVLLTGGAGFIGSHLAEALLRRGSRLTIVDNLNSCYDYRLKKANLEAIGCAGDHEFYAVDVCNMAQLSEVMALHRPDAVIHLAACVGVRPSIHQPHLYEQVNIQGTLNLLELCRQFRVRRFIFGSSSSVYGATSCVPFSEEQVKCRRLCPFAPTRCPAGRLPSPSARVSALHAS